MSSTRRAKPNSELSQERFASANAFRKALLANLVAKRCATVKVRAARELIWFLQDLSTRETHDRHPTCNLFAAWPWESDKKDEASFERIARELQERYPAQIAVESLPALRGYLPRLCLDPDIDPEAAHVKGCSDLFAVVQDYKRQFEAASRARLAMTETASQVFEVCEYALSQRGMTVALGKWRTGKSMAAQTFAQTHLGLCRYVQLTSDRDDTAFFRNVARAIGVASNSQLKSTQLRGRIEATLRTQQLALVFDECDWLIPRRERAAEPIRLNWVMTSLVNQGVPVALIGSQNFVEAMDIMSSRLPSWGREQWEGRVRLRRNLPERPTGADLRSIIQVLVPDGTSRMHLLLLGHAIKSGIPVPAIESAVARARWFAQTEERPLAFEDIEAAMKEAGTLPEDEASEAEAAPSSRRIRVPLGTAPRVEV